MKTKKIIIYSSILASMSLGLMTTTSYAEENIYENNLQIVKQEELKAKETLDKTSKDTWFDPIENKARQAEIINILSQKVLLEKKFKEEEARLTEIKKQELNPTMPRKAFKVTAKYESNNRNPGAVLGELDDGAGQNYGTYSLTENYTMTGYLKFLEEHYPDLRSQLTGSVNSNEFNSSWEALGQSEPEKFQDSQAQYLFEKTIMPRLAEFKKDTGVDLLDGSHTTGAVGIFSGMIHNAGVAWYDYLVEAAEIAKTDSGFDDNLFISTAAGFVADNYNGVYRDAIRSRYVRQPLDEMKETEPFFYTSILKETE